MSKGAFVVATIAVLGVIACIGVISQNAQSNTLITVTDVNEQAIFDLFNHWKLTYGKMYATESQETEKYATFKANYMWILNWNADPTSTSVSGLNQFSDMNTAEFSAHISCLNAGTTFPTSATVWNNTDVGALPSSWNWNSNGAVTPIKNQGQCGSCWAFSTTGSLEGLNFITNKNLLSFSEQQLVDCSSKYGNQGCNGGLMDDAFKYVEAEGIELESQYPYTAATGTCKYAAADVKFKNTGYTDVTTNNGAALQTAVYAGPVSIAIEADQPVFQNYQSGVITSKTCGTSLDHGVLNVGWGTDGSTNYWIVKNSWGASWGAAGFVWIERSATGAGICGINSMPSFPTV